MSKVKRYFFNVLLGLDQFANILLGGDPDETVSSRVAKHARKGRWWALVLCRVFDLLQAGHCEKALEEDEGGDAVIERIS